MELNQTRQVTVIGGGPGGYVAAIRAAQLGARVTLIEEKSLGGTCLNVGCIPTKALLHAAELVRSADDGRRCGVQLSLGKIDWTQVQAFKDGTVKRLVDGVAGLLKSNKVDVIQGRAHFIRTKTLEINLQDGSRKVLEADRIIIATGSVPVKPPIPGLSDSRFAVDSTGALNLEALPSSMAIIGAGVIGIEFACAFQAMGCQVTIIEAMGRLAPAMDREMTELLAESLRKQGITILLSHKVEQIEDLMDRAKLTLSHGTEFLTVEAEIILSAVGRRPFTDNLTPEAAGLRCERGRIQVNEHLETNIPGVYAIGDCVGQVMLAHAASAMGETAAENALGGSAVWKPCCIPSGIYSFPELAGVGDTEEQLQEKGIPYHVGKFPLSANGRALIANGGEGLVKVLIGDELDEVLGLHILGPHATELIGEGAASIRLESTANELIDTVHAHPTLTEAVREAVLAAQGRAIHIPNRKKKA